MRRRKEGNKITKEKKKGKMDRENHETKRSKKT